MQKQGEGHRESEGGVFVGKDVSWKWNKLGESI